MKFYLIRIASCAFILGVIWGLYRFYYLNDEFSINERKEMKLLQSVLVDPLDCSLTFKGKKQLDAIVLINECPLEARRFEVKNNRYTCTKESVTTILKEKFHSLLVIGFKLDIKNNMGVLTIRGLETLKEQEFRFDIKLDDTGTVLACEPKINDDIASKKNNLESYPGAGAIDL